MRKRFEQELSIDQLLIEDTEINLRDKSAVKKLNMRSFFCFIYNAFSFKNSLKKRGQK